MAGLFVDDEGDVASAHHWLAVALLVEVWAAEEEGEHVGAFVRSTHEILFGLWEHVGDGRFTQSCVEGADEGDDILFAHCFIDGGRDAVGLGGAAGGGVDWFFAVMVRQWVIDIHGGR
mgnify:CR=1 FL=1